MVPAFPQPPSGQQSIGVNAVPIYSGPLCEVAFTDSDGLLHPPTHVVLDGKVDETVPIPTLFCLQPLRLLERF